MANKTSSLQRWLESIWYDKNKTSSISRLLLIPLSYLYSAINNYQRKTQTANLLKSGTKLSCPVIVVGNITVGGTGKTPLTIHIVKLLQQAGYKPAIITRGYGGKATIWPQSVVADSDASIVGDEAVLMASSTAVPVYAGANRLESIEQLLKAHDCDVIVSDDGMQHYKLPRDIQIAVIDGERQLGNGYCLPAGPLREKKERLKDCDLIVVNGQKTQFIELNHDGSDTASNETANHDVENHDIENRDIESYEIESFEMSLSGQTLINLLTLETKPLNDFDGQTIQALTGIGNPQRFYSSLKAQGLKVIENSFPDHYAFEKSDLNFDEASTVIMTEKDAVKCKPLISDSLNGSKQYWCLPVTAKLPNEFNIALLTKLKALVTARIQSN